MDLKFTCETLGRTAKTQVKQKEMVHCKARPIRPLCCCFYCKCWFCWHFPQFSRQFCRALGQEKKALEGCVSCDSQPKENASKVCAKEEDSREICFVEKSDSYDMTSMDRIFSSIFVWHKTQFDIFFRHICNIEILTLSLPFTRLSIWFSIPYHWISFQYRFFPINEMFIIKQKELDKIMTA